MEGSLWVCLGLLKSSEAGPCCGEGVGLPSSVDGPARGQRQNGPPPGLSLPLPGTALSGQACAAP